MRVMKFISLAVALAMLLTLAIAQQAAPAQNAPAVKHVPITRCPAELGQRDVQQLLRRLPWERRKGRRTGGFGDEDSADRPDSSGKEQWRKVSDVARGRRDSRTGDDGFPWQPGYAGLGTSVLQHQPRA